MLQPSIEMVLDRPAEDVRTHDAADERSYWDDDRPSDDEVKAYYSHLPEAIALEFKARNERLASRAQEALRLHEKRMLEISDPIMRENARIGHAKLAI